MLLFGPGAGGSEIALKSVTPGVVMPTKQPHTFGVDDRLVCPECCGEMIIIQRTTDIERGGAFEWQTFECTTCLNRIERSVDKQSALHRK